MLWGIGIFGWDFVILLPALALAIFAQYKVSSTYNRYATVRTASGTSAQQAARRILDSDGVTGVSFERIPGKLKDHYDPRGKILRLCEPDSQSIADVGVAAHEAGHAIQHAKAYRPLMLRSAVVPVANVGSSLAIPLFIMGFVLRFQPLVTIGILAFAAALLFTLITLPVEFNASRRAVAALRSSGSMNEEEIGAVKEVLSAAALTYVAAAAMAALQLVMLLMAANRRR